MSNCCSDPERCKGDRKIQSCLNKSKTVILGNPLKGISWVEEVLAVNKDIVVVGSFEEETKDKLIDVTEEYRKLAKAGKPLPGLEPIAKRGTNLTAPKKKRKQKAKNGR